MPDSRTRTMRRAGAELTDADRSLAGLEAVAGVARPPPSRSLRWRRGPSSSASSSRSPTRRASRDCASAACRVRDGVDPADHASAVDGRAVVAGDSSRIQGRAARRRPRAAPLPDAHDRRRDDRTRARARHRRGRRRAPGDRNGAPARRGRVGLRRAARRRRAGREPRRRLPRPRRPRPRRRQAATRPS